MFVCVFIYMKKIVISQLNSKTKTMKKYILLLFTFSSIMITAQNSGGPGPYGYSWYNSDHATRPANYNWIDIEAPENYVDGLGDDNIVGPFNVAPAFDYYWYSVDKIWIGSNGYVGFKVRTNVCSCF